MAGDGDQRVDIQIWRRAVDEIVVVSCVKRRIIKRSNKSGVVVIRSREYVRFAC